MAIRTHAVFHTLLCRSCCPAESGTFSASSGTQVERRSNSNGVATTAARRQSLLVQLVVGVVVVVVVAVASRRSAGLELYPASSA